MQGKTVLITGATDGIGQATAEALAVQGARVIAVGRNQVKGEMCIAAMRKKTGNGNMDFCQADLSSQKDVRRLARTIQTEHDGLDVLINNAGGLFASRKLSADGIEMTLALNHLAYFLLTRLLLDQLRATPGARIVNVASHAHRGARLDFDDLQFSRRYAGWTAYQRSKLCNLLFTHKLARKLGPAGPTVNALHPGFVRSHLGQGRVDNSVFWRGVAAVVFRLPLAISTAEGARPSVHLASAPELAGVTGEYFSSGVVGRNRLRIRPTTPSEAARDPAIAARLWDVSEALISS